MKRLSGLVLLLCLANFLSAQDMRMDTYCNPLNIDYTYMIYNSDKNISYRSGADPAVVEFRGEYYMFVTRSHGYWRSRDLLNWEFVRPGRNWYPQGCNAPAAHNYKDSVLYVTGDPSGSMSILYTDNPASGNWEAVPAILHNLQDPDLFIDDDGKAYMFWGPMCILSGEWNWTRTGVSSRREKRKNSSIWICLNMAGNVSVKTIRILYWADILRGLG